MTPILALVGVASLVAALVWASAPTQRLHVVWSAWRPSTAPMPT